MLSTVRQRSVIAFLRAPGLRTLARYGLAPTMPEHDRAGASISFELKCATNQLKGARLGFSQDGAKYKLSCRSLTDTELASLAHAARSNARVRLSFADGNIVLSHIELQACRCVVQTAIRRMRGTRVIESSRLRPTGATR